MRLLSSLLNRNRVTLLGVLSWFILYTIFQFIDPYVTISNCSFPRISNDIEYDSDISISKVLLIADPQLIDNHTYPGRISPLLKLSKFTVDNYIYKNYKSLINQLEPQTIIFLGDLLDNGRESTDEYYEGEYQRFIRIFVKPAIHKNIELITNIPGNHDIGWSNGVTHHSYNRFIEHFGHPNKIIVKGNHDLILIDDLSISNTADDEIAKPTKEFLNTLKDLKTKRTKILLSHVPLWRDPNVQTCGVFRESKKPFPISKGYQYQTVIDETESLEILRSVNAEIIFSGDDHDYCAVTHPYMDANGIKHNTLGINIKSMSMAMGIHAPAVELLTLYNKPVKLDDDWIVNGQLIKGKGEFLDYSFETCYLTKPYIDVISYVCLAVINGIWLLINCFEKKKRFVGITDNSNDHENYSNILINNINWLRFFKLASVNGILVITLFYFFTIH